ncbi:MAG TPA: MarR family transcriptional regulator [Roseiflexaceae bacterium]|nr:MarR family transcriptional regulator [Roseiflexaceae bacterium]
MSYGDYWDNPIFWLRRASLAMRKAVDEELHAHGLTGAQFEVLRQLWEHDRLELRTLQERLGITSPTLTGIVDGMVGRGLVQREVSLEDARVKQLCLTQRGQSLNAQICEAIEQAHLRLLAGFTPAEASLLKDWLQRIVANAGGSDYSCS